MKLDVIIIRRRPIVQVRLADGSLASFAVTTGCQRQITRHHFCFRNLSVESNLIPYGNTVDPWTFNGDTPEIDEQIQNALAEYVDLPQGMIGEFYRAYQALQQDSELPVTLQDARRAVELITAARLSPRCSTSSM